MQEEQIYARIRKSSKYYWQKRKAVERGEYPFRVTILENYGDEYVVKGGPGGQYRLCDVDLFAVRDGDLVCISEPEGPMMVQLKAIVQESSRYFSDNQLVAENPSYGIPFPVCIDPEADDGYVVVGGPRPYRLEDVALFVQNVKVSLNVN